MDEDWYRRRFHGQPARGKMHKQPWQTLARRLVRVRYVQSLRSFPTKKQLSRYCLKEWRSMGRRMEKVSGRPVEGGETGLKMETDQAR